MNFKQLNVVFTFVLFLAVGECNAAGSPVHEDFSLVMSLCNDMVVMAQNGNQEGFLNAANSALKLSEAMRRDNSMAIDRFRPKLRAAKKAGKLGDLNSAAKFVEDAKVLMKPNSTKWDGGL